MPGPSGFGQDYPEYEEIALFLDVPGLGGRDMDVLIMGNEVYLPITDLFDFLMIRNIPSPGLDTISGFFINQEATYLIDRDKNQIQYAGELFALKPGDLIRTETNLYLRGYYFGHIFGLDDEFDFRTMSVRINTRLELPAIREMRLQAMRKNMNRLVGEVEADTIIERSYPWFHFGMADWSANVTEQVDGHVDSRLSLGLGSIIAGGEATVALNYNSFIPFTEKQQYYLWRYVNNDNKAVRQVMAGKIATGATSSIYDPVVGAKITNTPTQFRRSFGTYTLTDRTEPDWIVELYVNNVLVDYTTADPAGFFTFEVPLVYGNTQVRLKFYGPWGEERTHEQNITIPFNFIPRKTLEYSVSAGIVEDNRQSKFSRANVFYGLSRSITIGTGAEYLSSVSSGEFMPFVNGSFRLASNLLLSGEYAPAVRSKGTLTYRLPSSLQFDLNYIYYAKGQKAINNNFREERKFSMSMPIRLNNFSVYNRFSINQLVLPTTNYTTSEWLISGALFGVSTNITSYVVFIGNTKPYFYSDISMSFRIPKNITIQPRAQYSYTNQTFLSAKLLAEKRVFKKGYLTASYEQNFRSNMYLLEFGLRYDFKFAQTSIATRHTDRSTTFIQYARGSIINDSQTNYVYTDNRSNVGKGGISIIPFIDKNANGTRDPGEPKVYGLNLRANSGRIEYREKDTTIRIFGLEPYTDCFIEFDQSSFDNIAWRLKYTTMNIAVDPNLIKLVEIPINVVGEAAGIIKIEHNAVVRGLARIIVNFYDKDQRKVGRTLTEDDGFYSYLGLNPGNYYVRIDSSQLRKLGMLSTPDSINFNIAANLDGDYVDGLDFIVKYDTLEQKEEPKNIDMIVHEEIEQDMESISDDYVIEIEVFKNETQADTLRDQLSALLSKNINLFPWDDHYKIQITGFATRAEVEESYPALKSKGINKIDLISLIGMLKPDPTTNIQSGETDPFKPFSVVDPIIVIAHEIIEDDVTSSEGSYAIEIGAFENETEAEVLGERLSKLLGKDVNLIYEDNLYKVRVTGYTTSKEVKESFPVLKGEGVSEIGLIYFKGMLNSVLMTNIPGISFDPFKPFSEIDTALLIANEMIEEDITTTDNSFALEIGAFENETEAEVLGERLSKLLGKDVSLIYEDNLYKVRITGFTTSNEVMESFPVLKGEGISEIDLIYFKGMLNSDLATNIEGIETGPVKTYSEKDTTVVIVHEITEEDMNSSTDRYVIQLGAFKRKENANILRKRLADVLGKEVIITFKDGYYKVRVIGFETSYEVKNYIPELVRNGFTEIWAVNLKGMQKQGTPSNKMKPNKEVIGTFTEKDTTYLIVDETNVKDMPGGKDSFAIQVGAFNLKINADVYRIKLATILGKEVEIFVENELYQVRIPGFRTKEEVDAYIPVLQKNGVSEMKIVNIKGMQKHWISTSRIDTIAEGIKKFTPIDTCYLINKEKLKEGKKSSSDSSVMVRKTIISEKKTEEIPPIPSEEKVIKKTEVKEKPVNDVIAEEPKKEIVASHSSVERKKTLEERLLKAEYRTGLYEARWPGVVFTIQIAASKSIDDPEVIKRKFDLSDDVEVDKGGEWYRFSVGHYIKYWRAREYRNILITRYGIEDAFIVAYKDGKKIMFTDLLAMVETTTDSGPEITVRPADSIAFTVQILATKDGNISESEMREKYDVDEVIFKEYNQNDGLYHYSIGNFGSYIEAAKVRNKIRASGIRDAFVVGYKDGERIIDLKSIY
jgi:cell division protein FtsN